MTSWPAASAPALDPLALAAIPAPRLVWVNGVLDEGLSNLTALPAGIRLGPSSPHGIALGIIAEATQAVADLQAAAL